MHHLLWHCWQLSAPLTSNVKPKLSVAEWALAKTRSVGTLQRYEGDPLLEAVAHPSVDAVELIRLCGDFRPRVLVIFFHVVGCMRCNAQLSPVGKVLDQQLHDSGISPLQDSLVLGPLRDCHLYAVHRHLRQGRAHLVCDFATSTESHGGPQYPFFVFLPNKRLHREKPFHRGRARPLKLPLSLGQPSFALGKGCPILKHLLQSLGPWDRFLQGECLPRPILELRKLDNF